MFTTEALVASVCGLAVQIFVGGRFYRNAYTQFRSCSWGMDALVVVATSTVVTYSFYSLIDCCVYDANHQHLLFDTAAMLLLFVTLGKFLESRAKQRTGDAVEALLALRPASATLLPSAELRDVAAKLSKAEGDASSLETEFRTLAASCVAGDVDADACEVGDVARVSQGEAVPADGVVILVEGGGSARLDESALTGESKPAKRPRGAKVFASSKNMGRSCYIRIEAVGGDALPDFEVIGGRLYTGPLFVKYNGVLRGLDGKVPFLVNTMITLCCPKKVADAYMGGAQMWEALLKEGLYVNLARPPATPANMTLLRCSLCAEHSEEEVGEILSIFETAGKEVGII